MEKNTPKTVVKGANSAHDAPDVFLASLGLYLPPQVAGIMAKLSPEEHKDIQNILMKVHADIGALAHAGEDDSELRTLGQDLCAIDSVTSIDRNEARLMLVSLLSALAAVALHDTLNAAIAVAEDAGVVHNERVHEETGDDTTVDKSETMET